MKKFLIVLVFVGIAGWNAYLWMGCGKNNNNNSGSATATLKFSNTNNSPLSLSSFIEQMVFGKFAYAATNSAATIFQMKLIAVYITQDIDPITQNNMCSTSSSTSSPTSVPQTKSVTADIASDGNSAHEYHGDGNHGGCTSTFYVNPLCKNDLMHCDISSGTAEDGAPYKNIITDYFDFGQSSVMVNAALNAQATTINTGSYKYARVEFCKLNQGSQSNIIWAGGSSGGNVSFQRNNCVVNSAVMNPPLVVNAGDDVTIKLAYDYSNAIHVGSDATGDNCTGSGSSQTCFTLPQFTPSVSK